jgi:23S rRNA (uracil1939-C5)-methyltransferase
MQQSQPSASAQEQPPASAETSPEQLITTAVPTDTASEAAIQADVPQAPFELNIDKLVYGGDGLGRHSEGEVLFVPWSAPGDRLSVLREPGTQKPAKGRIAEILTPSPERTQPLCDVFGICGGCQWQHMNVPSQRAWKRNIVLESLARIGKLGDVPVAETIGSDDDAWRYRNRVQWEIEPDGEEWDTPGNGTGGHRLGYHQAQSHDVVEFSDCRIMPEPLNQLALWLRETLQGGQQGGGGEMASGLLRVEAFENAKGEILLSLHGERKSALRTLAESAQEQFPQIVGVVHFDTAFKFPKGRPILGEGFLTEKLAGKTFRVSAGSFFQTNRSGAEKLTALLQSWLPDDTRSLLDLYAGVGTFALCLHDKAKRVVAIESSETAMADARENIRRNNVRNVELKTGDAKRVLATLKDRFEAAVIDPPRSGCPPEVLSWLNQHVQKHLLYVSCNPTTLARDLKTLVGQGWVIEAVQPIDMFPQTYHVETLVHLVKPS